MTHASIDYTTRRSTKRKISSAERRALAEGKEIKVESPPVAETPTEVEIVETCEKAMKYVPGPKQAYKKYESVDEMLIDVIGRVGSTVQSMARRVEKNSKTKKISTRGMLAQWTVFKESVKMVLDLEALIKQRDTMQLLPKEEKDVEENK